MHLMASMMAKKAGSSSSVRPMTTMSMPMPMMIGRSPLLTTNLTTVISRRSSIQIASTMKAKPDERNSPRRPKKRSKSDEPIVMVRSIRSSSAVVMPCESKAGTTKSPSASSLSRRAVAVPKV